MKFYQSPLSLTGIIVLLAGIYLCIAMLAGSWPTYFAFIFLGVGILMLIVDYFIRKSKWLFKTKLIVQTLCFVIPLLFVYLFFSGKL